MGGKVQLVATSRLVAPSAIRWTTLSSESVRLSQPVFARGGRRCDVPPQSAQRAAHPAGIGNRFALM